MIESCLHATGIPIFLSSSSYGFQFYEWLTRLYVVKCANYIQLFILGFENVSCPGKRKTARANFFTKNYSKGKRERDCLQMTILLLAPKKKKKKLWGLWRRQMKIVSSDMNKCRAINASVTSCICHQRMASWVTDWLCVPSERDTSCIFLYQDRWISVSCEMEMQNEEEDQKTVSIVQLFSWSFSARPLRHFLCGLWWDFMILRLTLP